MVPYTHCRLTIDLIDQLDALINQNNVAGPLYGVARLQAIDTEEFLVVTDALRNILDLHKGHDGALLPILHDVQATFGHINEADIRTIASTLNLTRAEVHGVVSFYHDFKTVPDSRPVIKLCRAEACKARGVEAMVADVEAAAGSRVKIETIYCLGLCAVGPAAMIGGEVYARLTAERLAELVAQS